MIHRLLLAVAAIVAFGACTTASTSHALAYGGGPALYQITMSFNCQNKTLCVASPSNPFGIGGGWGWIDLSSNLTGDIQFEGQGHDNADPALNGAVHFAGDVSAVVLQMPSGPLLVIQGTSGTALGFVIGLPATPGHYQLPPTGPGISNQVQISMVH